jgi:L-ribulose-5-phosphate 3-epimerase
MKENSNSRRDFLRKSLLTAGSLSILPLLDNPILAAPKEPLFKISLGQWSFNRAIKTGKLNPLDFPALAKKDFGVEAVEYVNQLFMDKAKDMVFLKELKKRCSDNGVKSLVLMVDQEGQLGAPDQKERMKSVENHYKWVEAAKFLGCHSVRVNAFSTGSYDDQLNYVAEGMNKLLDFAEARKMNIIVENHGGMSSKGDWLAKLMKKVNRKNFGTMPDFDNFQVSPTERYDRYKGMEEIMPWAKSVSTKAHDFDSEGNETTIDYKRMFQIVLKAGYHGYVSAEYEGNRLSEEEGTRALIKLMEKVRTELSA